MRRRSGILFLFLLGSSLSLTAQRGDSAGGPRLDTTVNDTIVVGVDDPIVRTHVDSSYSAGLESGGAAATTEPSPVLRTLPDTTVRRWQDDRVFAYANDPEYWKIRRERPNAFSRWLSGVLLSKGFRYAVLLLLGGLLIFAIVRIAMENNLSLFYRGGRKRKGSGDDTDSLLEEEDIDQRLQHFLQAGDKRQATRYLYLKTLRLLSARNLIRRHADTTNQEYLRQLKDTPPEAAFRFLTGAYERVWYGDFVLSDASFRRLHDYFSDLHKTLEA